jgi:hypothetical protein
MLRKYLGETTLEAHLGSDPFYVLSSPRSP